MSSSIGSALYCLRQLSSLASRALENSESGMLMDPGMAPKAISIRSRTSINTSLFDPSGAASKGDGEVAGNGVRACCHMAKQTCFDTLAQGFHEFLVNNGDFTERGGQGARGSPRTSDPSCTRTRSSRGGATGPAKRSCGHADAPHQNSPGPASDGTQNQRSQPKKQERYHLWTQ